MPTINFQSGTCLHCATPVRFSGVREHKAGPDGRSSYEVSYFYIRSMTSDEEMTIEPRSCPNCGRISLRVEAEDEQGREMLYAVWPSNKSRPVPVEVSAADEEVASDMREAAAVLTVSPKASAALSRRALQHILERKAGATKRRLSDQIEEVLGSLPPDLAENIDAIREVGNFAAHPIKSEDTGAMVNVEAGEAEFTLEILWEVAEYYYVRPERLRQKRDSINELLRKAGRDPLKGSESEESEERPF